MTRLQQKKLRRKLNVKTSAENTFAVMYMSELKKAIGNRIAESNSWEEVEDIINNIDVKRLKKIVRNLRNEVLKKNNDGFENVVKAMTAGMRQVTKYKADEKNFAKAMNRLIKDKRIYEPLMAKFEANMLLIKDLPKSVYKDLRKAYKEGRGFRGSEIEEKIYEKMGNRAKLIVRTESAKVNSAITECRARSIGVKAYIWSTSEDKRVRDTHSMMNGVLVFWDNQPTFVDVSKNGRQTVNQHGCGEIYNCRCVALPVFDLDDISFPIKVARNAVITSKYLGNNKYNNTSTGIELLTKQRFLKEYGNLFLESSSRGQIPSSKPKTDRLR